MENNLKKLRILIILILVLLNVFILIKYLIKGNNISQSNLLNNNANSTNIVEEYIENMHNEKTENEIYEEVTQNTNELIQKKLSNMDENSRMQTYFGEFIEEIENANYRDAYNMLNEEYKNKYFPNQSDFENYIKSTYPRGSLAVKYNNFDRKGDIYTLQVTIFSITNTNANKINQTIVIKENGKNDFKISFSK